MKITENYTVVKGDTLFGIARRFNMSVSDLKTLNGLRKDNLNVGQILKVLVEKSSTPVSPKPAPPTPTAPSAPASPVVNNASYTVVRGDTLFGLARRFNTTVDVLRTLNKLSGDALNVGQVLRVPAAAVASPPATPVVPPPVTPAPVVEPPAIQPAYLLARRQFGLAVRQDVDCRRFELTVPVLGNRMVTARMRDNVHYSAFMVYPEGVVYGGQSVIEVPIPMLEAVGLTEQQARALEYVSTHEGKYDAINTYDAGIFSFGFIQFVGAAQHGGSLNRLLAAMKANAPASFTRTFQSVGIDVDQQTMTVLDDAGRLLRGDEAWFYVQKNVQLYGAFIQAGFDPALVMEQLRAANTLYVQPALNFRLDMTINGIRVAVPRLRDIISSEGLLTALIAIAINRGAGSMSRTVAEAVSTVAAPMGLQNPEMLRTVDERAVLQTIANTTTDTRTRDRAMGVLQAGLSFEKAV